MKTLIDFSQKYGSNPELVLAGGGNTSMKENGVLYVKASGTQLASITQYGFVALDMEKLLLITKKAYPLGDAEREADFLADITAAKLPGQEDKRPSVETLLHALFPHRYVLHLHPALINGITCALGGEEAAGRLFPEAIWMAECRPGYTLAMELAGRLGCGDEKGADTVLLQNHGVFFAADEAEKLDEMLSEMLEKIRRELDKNWADITIEPELCKPLTPDHIVYCGVGPELPDTENARLLWQDARKIAKISQSFGGLRPMSHDLVDFIRNWEAESYRKSRD